jgi:hypothetical protein
VTLLLNTVAGRVAGDVKLTHSGPVKHHLDLVARYACGKKEHAAWDVSNSDVLWAKIV